MASPFRRAREQIIHKPIVVAFLLVLACTAARTPAAVWQPSPGHVQVQQSLAYYVALQKAGVPTELHSLWETFPACTIK
jgi:hypothetical protein